MPPCSHHWWSSNRRSPLRECCASYYAEQPFIRVLDREPRIKDVVGTNECHLGVAVDGDVAVVLSAIDNLTKGAAGGALQWMNRLWGLEETAGLELCPPAWT